MKAISGSERQYYCFPELQKPILANIQEKANSEHEKVWKQLHTQVWETVEQRPEPGHSGLVRTPLLSVLDAGQAMHSQHLLL